MQRRHLGKMFLLLTVTMGMYIIYWLVKTRREMLKQGATPIPSVWVLFLPFFALLTLLLIVLLYSKITTESNTGASIVFFLVGMAAFLAIFVVTPYWIWQYAKAVEKLTGGETSRHYVFWMWLLLGGPWALVIQHEFNIVATNQSTSPAKSQKAISS